MNKHEYEEKLKFLDGMIDSYIKDRENLVKDFRKCCQHDIRHISVTENHYEDDIGMPLPEWDDYTYVCENCKYSVDVLEKFKSHEELVKAFSGQTSDI
jgi:hypothetical protein